MGLSRGGFSALPDYKLVSSHSKYRSSLPGNHNLKSFLGDLPLQHISPPTLRSTTTTTSSYNHLEKRPRLNAPSLTTTTTGNSQPSNAKPGAQCFKCKQIGHWATNCPLNRSKANAMPTTPSSSWTSTAGRASGTTATASRRKTTADAYKAVYNFSAGPPVELSAEQKRGLKLALSGKSLFFTGSAGASLSLPSPSRQIRPLLFCFL